MATYDPRTCKHCAAEFIPKRFDEECCGPTCRKAFNNLRMTRGAALYDAVMAWRYDRKLEQTSHGTDTLPEMDMGELRTLVQDLSKHFRDEDVAEGRGRTWNDPRIHARKNPHIRHFRSTHHVSIGRGAR